MHHAAGIYGAVVPESILLYRLQMLKSMGCNAIRTVHNPFSSEFYNYMRYAWHFSSWWNFWWLGKTNQWPSRFANFGVIDIANLPKDHYYLYQSLWAEDSMVHILPHWTHLGKEGDEIPVVIYTNSDEVELFWITNHFKIIGIVGAVLYSFDAIKHLNNAFLFGF